jgi:hypothetical protein
MEPPQSLPITAYVLEGADESFAGYAIEEIEVPVPNKDDEEKEWVTGYETGPTFEAKSVAAVVVTGAKVDIKAVVAGLQASQKALAADEVERAAKKEAEEKSSAK